MNILKTYFPKRYFFYFVPLFICWYAGSLVLFTAYSATQHIMFYTTLQMLFPVLIFIFAYLYFKKSINDWNDRFAVGFGWVFLGLLFAVLLAPIIYGVPIVNSISWGMIEGNFFTIVMAFIASFVARRKGVGVRV